MADDYIKGMLTSGEVLLIETRQHWVAAIRYAIRPLLIIGLAVLLSILNQWLRFETLGFINDIVHWLIILALIVALVWLPIDLAQWWSRRYVLTNRRATRMQGILRKSSFDSSLEQINDIMLSQSFLGRKLGYADLTLLTANASNEAYEQLLDGPQFKRAVLDAKEAIRAGHPLQSLPEGFVVRGGTNEASIRAAAKPAETTTVMAAGEDAAAGATAVGGSAAIAAAASAPADVAPTSPQPAPSPAPLVEPTAPASGIEDAEIAAEARDALTGSTLEAPTLVEAEAVAEAAAADTGAETATIAAEAADTAGEAATQAVEAATAAADTEPLGSEPASAAEGDTPGV